MAVRAFILLLLVLVLIGLIAKGDFTNPIGVVILMSALGPIDIRRRKETTLWGNLGYPTWIAAAVYGTVGLIGELAIGLIRMAVH